MLQSFPLVRLAALDLDGTLLNRNNEVTLATRQAIARAVEHGVVVVPATGRPLASLPPVVAKLPGIRYAITSNGAAVWDLGDDPMGAVHSRYANAAQRHTSEPACLLHRLMPTEVAREAFDLFQQYDGELSVFSDGLAIKTPEGIAKLTSRTARFLSSEARQNLTDGRFTVIPGIGYLITAGVVRLLKVDRETMKQIQSDLEKRRNNYRELNDYQELKVAETK